MATGPFLVLLFAAVPTAVADAAAWLEDVVTVAPAPAPILGLGTPAVEDGGERAPAARALHGAVAAVRPVRPAVLEPSVDLAVLPPVDAPRALPDVRAVPGAPRGPPAGRPGR